MKSLHVWVHMAGYHVIVGGIVSAYHRDMDDCLQYEVVGVSGVENAPCVH